MSLRLPILRRVNPFAGWKLRTAPRIFKQLKATELIPTRATLLEKLRDWENQTSWREFFDTYWRLIYSVARKAGLTEVEAQDVVQETLMAVAKHIPTFRYDPALGSFKGWLLKMARWRIVDQLRKRGPLNRHPKRSASRTAARTATVEAIPDPGGAVLDQLWDEEWQTNLLESAVQQVKRKLDPRKYQIFDCYVNKGWDAAKVAKVFGITVEQVYVDKHRITRLIKDEVARLEKELT